LIASRPSSIVRLDRIRPEAAEALNRWHLAGRGLERVRLEQLFNTFFDDFRVGGGVTFMLDESGKQQQETRMSATCSTVGNPPKDPEGRMKE